MFGQLLDAGDLVKLALAGTLKDYSLGRDLLSVSVNTATSVRAFLLLASSPNQLLNHAYTSK